MPGPNRSLLIITQAEDVHADNVIRASATALPAWQIVRLHPETMATNLRYHFEITRAAVPRVQAAKLLDSRRDFGEPSVVWWRKPDWPTPHPKLSNRAATECSRIEYRDFLLSLPGLFPSAVWVNDYWIMQKYSIKINQLKHAQRNGFCVPETLLTTSASEVREFVRKFGECILKPFNFPGFHDGQSGYACWTNVLSSELLEQITDESLQFAPAFIQRRIRKVQELRITVFGNDVHACSISTNHDTPEGIDWRIEDVQNLKHQIVQVPERVADGLRGMLRDMGLHFGAFDVILDDQGEYILLELNPNGQWLWIEQLTGAPLTASMLNLIADLGK